MDLNLNYAHCIKEAHNWGADKFVNICTGNTTIVNWGSLDWTFAIGSIAFLGGITLLVTGMFYGMYQSYKELDKVYSQYSFS